MNAHTPGKWQYRTSDGIFDAEGRRLCALSFAGKAISQRITYDEQEANARLIAAAPDLLVALREYIAFGDMGLVPIADETRALLARIDGKDGNAAPTGTTENAHG